MTSSALLFLFSHYVKTEDAFLKVVFKSLLTIVGMWGVICAVIAYRM